MSTRTDWGYFDKNGAPLAVGDLHASWACPNQEWVYGETTIDDRTGEEVSVDPYHRNCPLEFVGVKVDRCKKCGVEFRYP